MTDRPNAISPRECAELIGKHRMTISKRPLSYCTNVHPGRSVAEVIDGLNEYTAPVRRKLDIPIAAGLWLNRSVISELATESDKLEQLAQTLWQNDLSTHTLNAFPFGDFHQERVKEQVYFPDWTETERLTYTQDCARILAQLLPENTEGTISTVPLGGTMNPSGPEFHAACFRNLIRCGRFLKDLHKETGRLIRLAVEPEPLCHISSVPSDAVPQFRALFEMADALSCESEIREHVGICLDICHQAVEFETLPVSIDQLNDEGIRINKVHLTNALHVDDPGSNPEALLALRDFIEPRYLHQLYAQMPDDRIVKRVDLSAELLEDAGDEIYAANAWRIHFHVPIFAQSLGPLRTTRADLNAALHRVAQLTYAPDLEVETYTWPVMPETTDVRAEGLIGQIAEELSSSLDLLASIGA